MERKTVTIRTEFIRMDALLKLAGLVMTGGEAKIIIQNGDVTFNGEICQMRGKKVRAGDEVGYNGTVIVVGEA